MTADEDPGQGRRPQPSLRRLWHAVVHPTRRQLLVAVVLGVLGFAIVTQVRTNTVDDTYAGLREQDLIDILNGLADTTQRATVEIQRLEATRDDLRSETNARSAALAAAQTELDSLRILAGTVPVTGPGVTITIEERAGTIALEPFIDLVQALRSAGAEAIVVNDDVRVVASTSFEKVEGGFRIDQRVLTAPYTIEVIGGPSALSAAVRFPSGPEDQIERDGLGEVSVEEQTRIEITTIRQVARAGVAEPAPDQ